MGTFKGKAFKKPKKKKKVLKQKPKQKSALKLKTTKKPQTFSRHAAKPKSEPLPKPKLKPIPKSKPAPKPKTKAHAQHHRPHLKIHSSGAPSLSGTSRPGSQTQIKSRVKTKSRRAASKNQTMLFQYQNMSQSGMLLPKSYPTPELKVQSLQPVWDTSVQAAIRVGDWKLLTGDPGHGDWVPPQVLQQFELFASNNHNERY